MDLAEAFKFDGYFTRSSIPAKIYLRVRSLWCPAEPRSLDREELPERLTNLIPLDLPQ